MFFHFAFPWAFLLFIPLAVAAWRLFRRSTKVQAIPFAPTHRLPIRTSGWRSSVARVTPFIFLLGMSLLIVAAARPQSYKDKENRSAEAISIAMVVDVSGSMDALDLAKGDPRAADAQTRLDVVKEVFADFINERHDDLVALVTFGGYASTRSPLTADHDTILHILKGVEIPGREEDDEGRQISNEETLTAIGDGLATACARLQNAETKSKIVILLSDGVSNTGIITPDKAADAAAKLGIKVYTVGVGSNGNAPFRVRGLLGRKTIAMGYVEFNGDELRNIAAKTGGKYFNVRDNKGFREAMKHIEKLETTEVTQEIYRHYSEAFVKPLVLGALALCISILLNMFIIRRPL